MWKYLIDVVAVRLVPEIDYNKKDISRNFLLMAHARLRQIRATVNDSKFSCEHNLSYFILIMSVVFEGRLIKVWPSKK